MAISKIGSNATGFGSDLTITDGDLLFATAAKGVCLGVTSNTDSNTIDDYEEGTFTPSFIGSSGSAGSHSITGAEGIYVKIGRQVFVHIRLVIANGGAGSYSGTNRLTGFPFASGSTNPSALAIGADSYNTDSNAFVITNGQTYGAFWDRFSNTAYNYTDFTTGYNMIVSGTYYTTA